MKKSFQLKPVLLSMAVAGSVALTATPAAVQAGEISYNAAVSNMYLWRGINISNPSPVVSGGIDYDFGNGFAIGTWASSEGAFDGSSEWDVYGSYGVSLGDFGFSIGYAAYLYPYAGKDMTTFTSDGGTMLGDWIVGLSYQDLSFTAYIDAETKDHGNNKYYTLDYSIGAFGLHAGYNTNDSSSAEYTEFKVSYAATDNLSFAISKAQGDGAKAIVSGLTGGTGEEAENPQLQVTYSFTF
ncbi:TorF family putative porin [Thiomicrorhabdus sp.]|uniref:TorF family putative porin n=1 Tax=Thiomicrorhabdus sp. TaxID=2039724 RepID=UPI0029C795BE|nr:TorF family putative porin [Thiomicrorhabdus sp.]